MNSKKVLCIIFAVLLAAIVAGLIFFKVKNDNTEIPDIEPVTESTNNTASEQNESVDEQKIVVPPVEVNKSNPQEQKPAHKVLLKKSVTEKPEIKVIRVEETITKSEEAAAQDNYSKTNTEEENDILKKVPASDVVVIDKEIKMKSRSKYVFK